MKLFLKSTTAAVLAVGALSLNSCAGGCGGGTCGGGSKLNSFLLGNGNCCTGEDPVPALRPVPNFDSPAPAVSYK